MAANDIGGKPNAPTSDNLRKEAADLLLGLLATYMVQD